MVLKISHSSDWVISRYQPPPSISLQIGHDSFMKRGYYYYSISYFIRIRLDLELNSTTKKVIFKDICFVNEDRYSSAVNNVHNCRGVI